MLVLLVELKNLKNSGAGVLEQVARLGFADAAGWYRAQRGQRFVQLGQKIAFAVQEIVGERALMLTEKPILLQGTLVKFVTKLLVLMECFGRRH